VGAREYVPLIVPSRRTFLPTTMAWLYQDAINLIGEPTGVGAVGNRGVGPG